MGFCVVVVVVVFLLHATTLAKNRSFFLVRQRDLSRGGKELLGSSDIGLDGRLALLPSDGADLTVLLVKKEMREKKKRR